MTTDIDPLSRYGLIVGMVVALVVTGINNNDTYTYSEKLDTTRQELGIEIRPATPEHPERGKLTRYACAKRLYFCTVGYVDTIIRYADYFDIPPAFILAMGVWEAPRTPTVGAFCSFGYNNCRTRFKSFDAEVWVVAETLSKYGGSLHDKYSIWRTGSVGDYAQETLRVVATAKQIGGL